MSIAKICYALGEATAALLVLDRLDHAIGCGATLEVQGPRVGVPMPYRAWLESATGARLVQAEGLELFPVLAELMRKWSELVKAAENDGGAPSAESDSQAKTSPG